MGARPPAPLSQSGAPSPGEMDGRRWEGVRPAAGFADFKVKWSQGPVRKLGPPPPGVEDVIPFRLHLAPGSPVGELAVLRYGSSAAEDVWFRNVSLEWGRRGL